jgi:TonB-linked SusC/RagA family outer membrane protein
VGYQPQTVQVNSQSIIDVTLIEGTLLDEVIVVGYGTQKKSTLVGSVAQLSSEEINDRPVTQLRQALTGQLPGVTVIQRSGQPGNQGGSIQIRGVNSVQSDNTPLILVDGIPTPNFNDIDPNVVENISILKDASTAAIYGSRAANGVILITTKTGKSDKLQISYNGYVGIQTATGYPQYADSWEYATLLNEANTNDGLSPAYTPEEIELFRNGSDTDNYPNSKFADEVLKKNSTQTGHNITLSNRIGSSSYLLSLGYMYQDGIIAENNYNRYNVRLNVVSDISDRLKLTTRLSGKVINDEQPSGPATLGNAGSMLGIIGQAVRYPAIFPIKLSNGDWGGGFEQSGTPVSFLASESFYNDNTTDLGANFQLDWTIIPHLKFSFIGGYTYLDGKNERFSATQQITPTNILSPASLVINNYNERYQTLQELLEYNRILGDHEITVLAGHTFESSFYETNSASRTGFPDNNITRLNAGSADGQGNSGTAREWAIDSYIGRLRYSFKNKYLLEGVVRYDGSSRFPPDNKYALFPSFAAGWRISEEAFLDGVSWIDELKLKASWGQVGAQALSGAAGYYPYQDLIRTGFNYPFGNNIQTGVAATTLNDPNLSWETTETYDIGFEASLFNNAVNFSATYFNKETFDLLLSPGSSISSVLGFGVGPQNTGISSNKGLELVVGYRKGGEKIRYGINANVTFLKNEMLDLGVANIEQPNGLVGDGTRFIGYPISIYYGLTADGLFVDQQDIDASVDQSAVNSNPVPGDIRYKDISGPDGIPDGKVDLTYDRTILGSTIPEVSYGIHLSGGYKGLNISALLQGVSGVNGRLNNASGLAFVNQGGIQKWQAEERWSSENPNPNAAYPRLEIIPNGGTPNSLLSSFWVLNGSYLKLRNVQVTYDLPSNLVQNLGLGRVQVTLTGENLFAIHNYREGWDPEINATLNYYPILANYAFGINVNF